MKLGVCVPYRNREAHLHEFVPKVGKYLKNQNIDFQMYFIHQADDKLFNRGATKNIGAKLAFEDGCDYIVWHDIDMIPEEGGGCDYSYPAAAPRHIATQISQMDYKLKYHEYFGGAVLFTKEQVEATNGYSNGYWDWGMEDDDLFWRCHKEGMLNVSNLTTKTNKVHNFNGIDSYIKIPYQDKYSRLVSKSHTISVLVNANHGVDTDIFLLGNKDVKYTENPIVTVPGYDYGFAFNNSRAMSFTYWNTFNQHNYMWVKRYDNQWSWLTVVLNVQDHLSHFYINGSEVDTKAGVGSPSPHTFNGRLKSYPKQDIFLGLSPNLKRYFKGQIADLKIWNRVLTPEEISELHNNIPSEPVLDLQTDSIDSYNIETEVMKFEIPNSILPHRVEGRMRCLHHEDEGIVNGKFVKGDTTAANERRYVLGMQQDKINYKEDGIKQVKYELVKEEVLTPWAKLIDIKL